MLNWFKKRKTDPRLPAAKDKHDRAVLGDIATTGWSVVCIEDAETPYAFSVGMFHTHRHPEIIILGLPSKVGGYIINQVGMMVVAGETIEPDRKYDEYTNTGNYFKTVNGRHYVNYVGYALWLYGGADFPLLQCVWPLKTGQYPWDNGYPAEGAEIQPLLT